MPYDQVDVNVHPNKMNVKFAHPNDMFDIFYRAVRQTIYNSINPVKEVIQPINIETNAANEITIEPNNTEFTEVFSNEIQPVKNEQFVAQNDAKDEEVVIEPVEPAFYSNKYFSDTIRLEKFVPERNASMFDKDIALNPTESHPSYQPISNFSDYKVIGEIFNEFLILEKGDTMLLIDFHAGHERLLYDKMVASVNSNSIDVQTLLVPYFHKLNVQEMEYISNLTNKLGHFGFETSQFGPNEIRVTTVPVLLSDINLKTFVEDLLHDMNNQSPKINDELDRMLMQKACKSAVKSGMTLSKMQIDDLLKGLDVNRPVLLCPHGRPIVTVVKKSQLEKWFKRIV